MHPAHPVQPALRYNDGGSQLLSVKVEPVAGELVIDIKIVTLFWLVKKRGHLPNLFIELKLLNAYDEIIFL